MITEATFKPTCLGVALFAILLLAGCSNEKLVDVVEVNAFDSSDRPEFRLQIREIQSKPEIAIGGLDLHGDPLTASCATCHTTREVVASTRNGDELQEFHQGLTMNHGKLSCLSCHNVNDYDTFHLADNSPVQ